MDSNSGILIGGSPSTGSSVLVNILNRHPDVVAGPETFLFMHPKLYKDWNRYKRFLIRRSKVGGLKSIGWFRMNGADLLDPFYGHSPASLRVLVARAGSFPAFAGGFFQPALQAKGARIWAEKSPSNALCLDLFLAHFPSGKAVHTTRDPYDAMASLVARGYSAFYAAGAYLINTSFALKCREEERCFTLRYEDWVLAPEKVLGDCFRFLDLEWDAGVLEPGSTEEAQVRMKGWLHDEKGSIAGGSVGRFFRLPEAQQQKILTAATALRIAGGYRERYALPAASMEEVCDMLGYAYHPVKPSSLAELKGERVKDHWKRLLRAYPTGWQLYPLTVSA